MLFDKFKMKGIVIGMLLGDAYIGIPAKSKNGISKHGQSKNARLSIAHCEKQLDYLKWKGQILENITSVRYDTAVSGYGSLCYRLHTKCHPFYTKLHHHLYYEGRKTPDEHCLKVLNEIGLAIWYMDDGFFNPTFGGSVELSTQGFNFAEHLLLQKALKIKWNLNWNICKHGKYYRLYLKHSDKQHFFETIGDTVKQVPCMLYKLQQQDAAKAEDIVRTHG